MQAKKTHKMQISKSVLFDFVTFIQGEEVLNYQHYAGKAASGNKAKREKSVF